MKKRIFSMAMALILCLSLLPATASAEDFHDHAGWTAWSTADALPSEAGSYYLTVDVTLSGVQEHSWRAPEGTISICLEGHTIDWKNNKYSGYSRNIMRVYTGSTLHIYDKEDNSGKITGGNAGGNGTYGKSWNHGGGVFVGGGAFYLHGGTITGNGGAYGGGVAVCDGGLFVMSGGVICDNAAGQDPWFTAAGVEVEGESTFTMTGGKITGNHGEWNNREYYSKWAVFVNAENNTFNVSGDAYIYGNAGSGGERNVYLGEGAVINVTGPLAKDTKIGVASWNKATEESSVMMTSGLPGNGTLDNFACDQNNFNTDANNHIRLKDGNVELFYALAYDVTVTPGANMTLSSGSESQSEVIGAMTDVVYTADDGYYFPEDYAVSPVNGITVTRDSYTQITVSGTPTAAASLTLPAPTAKEAHPTPAASFTADGDKSGILTVPDAGAYTLTYKDSGGQDVSMNITQESDTSWPIDDIGPCAITVTRIPSPFDAVELATKLDSEAQTIEVTKALAPLVLTAVGCTESEGGKITGTETYMEYMAPDSDEWNACPQGELTDLAAGKYVVRAAASGATLASDSVTLTVAAYVPPEATATPALPDPCFFRGAKSIEITCETEGATIYYTTDGTAPTAESAVYTAPFEITATATVRAIAVKEGMTDSEEASATYTLSFTDVKEGAFYENAVNWAVANGVTSGTSETTFSPDNDCTRGQVVAFLWRAAGSPEPTVTSHPFTDVKESAFYYKAMLWAVEKGITNGISATAFGPKKTCTRGQVVTFLWRAAGSTEPTATAHPFTDVSESGFYYKAMLWAVENGVTNGVSATAFGPGKTCTRGQVVTFLYRAFDK